MEDYEYEHSKQEAGIDHVGTDNIVCPCCGYEYGYEESRKMVPQNLCAFFLFDVECRQCRQMFSAAFEWGVDEDGEEDNSMVFYTYHENQSQYFPKEEAKNQ